MAIQNASVLPMRGIRFAELGLSTDLVIAAPLTANPYNVDAGTDATRIGLYFDRAVGDEKIGVVINGVDSIALFDDRIEVLGSRLQPLSEKGMANGYASLDGTGKVPIAQLPPLGGLMYQGLWNASTNTPTLVSSVGTNGYYYIVSVAGSTNLNGITDWLPGDWAIFDGATTAWQKIDNTSVGGSGTAGQVAYWNGVETITGDVQFTYGSGQLVLGDYAASASLSLKTADNQAGTLDFYTATNTARRWSINKGATTHPLNLTAYDASGSQIDIPISIANAAAGLITVVRPITTDSSVTITGTAATYRQILFAPTDTAAANSIPLQVTSTPNPASSSAAIFGAINAQVASSALCAQTFTSTSPAGLVAGTFTVNHFGTNTLTQGIGLRGVANLRSGGGATTALAAVNGVIGNASANTVTLAATFRAELGTNTGGGAITRMVSYQSDRQTVGTNNFGFLYGSTVVTGNWCIYNNTVDHNYLGSGATLINSTTDDGVNKLQVTGGTFITGALTGISASGILARQAATQDGMTLLGRAGGSGSYQVYLTSAALTTSRTVTFPDADVTVHGGSGTMNQVAYWSSSSVLASSANFTFDGTNVGMGGTLTVASLTSGRVPYVSTAGLLVDSASLTYDGTVMFSAPQVAGQRGTITSTTNQAALYGSVTWNNVAVPFTASQIDVTDTASAAASMLISLRVGGTPQFSVRKDGQLTIASTQASISAITGSVLTAGGIGALKDVFSATGMTVDGSTVAVTANPGFSVTRAGGTTGANLVRLINSGGTDYASLGQQGSSTNAAILWATANTSFLYAPTRFRVSTGTAATDYFEVTAAGVAQAGTGTFGTGTGAVSLNGSTTLTGAASTFTATAYAPTVTSGSDLPFQWRSVANPASSSSAVYFVHSNTINTNAACAQNLTATFGLVGILNTLNHQGSGTLTGGFATRAVANVTAAGGNVTTLAANNAIIQNLSPNTVTIGANFYGEAVANTGGGAVTRAMGVYQIRHTAGANNFGFFYGTSGGTGNWCLYNNTADANYLGTGATRIGTTSALNTAEIFTALGSTANTATTAPGLVWGANSTGTAAAGFGVSEQVVLESSTTDSVPAFQRNVNWATATHATRKGRISEFVYDTAARQYLQADTDGAAAFITLPSTTNATTATAAALILAGGSYTAKNHLSAMGQGWGVQSVATAASTTTLTATSQMTLIMTGATTETVQLPAANLFGVGIGVVYFIKNTSSGTVTVQRAGADTLFVGASVTSTTLTTGQSMLLVSDGVSLWAVMKI